MKTNLMISVLLILFISSCRQENNDLNAFNFSANVIGRNPDCGVFSINFTSKLDEVKTIAGDSPVSTVYIAKNLPVELQQPGIKIRLNIRKIKDTELGACTAMGPSYPWVFVINAQKE